MEARATQLCVAQLSLRRLSSLPQQCSCSRNKIYAPRATRIKQCLTSEHSRRSAPKESWKTWLWRDEEKNLTSFAYNNPAVGISDKARCVVLILYRTLLLGGIGLSIGAPAMAGSSPSPVSEVLHKKSVKKAAQNTTVKSPQDNAQNEAAEKNTLSDSDESVGLVTQVEAFSPLVDDFWKDISFPRGSIELILKNILEGDPTNRDALQCLARTLMENDYASHALTVVEKLELLEPNEIEWKYMKAQVYEMDGQFQLAKKSFEEILQNEPFSARAMQGLMVAMDELDETEDAIVEKVESMITRARVENNKTEARNMGMLLGQFLMTKGYLNEALVHYQEMMDEDAKDFRPHLCQGIIYSALGEKTKADHQFKIYEKLCPKDYQDRKMLDALMSRARHEGQKIYELKQKEKYVRTAKDQKQSPEQASEK